MSRKLSLIPLMLLLLSGCATASSEAPRYAGVPLTPYTKEEQAAASAKVDAACGVPAKCPREAILEQMVIDYQKLRAAIRAIGK